MSYDQSLIDAVVSAYDPAAPNSFQDVANNINADFANGAFTDWIHYDFPYDVPSPDTVGLQEYVSQVAFTFANQDVEDACNTGVLFNTTLTDTENKRGGIWCIYYANAYWPPPDYPV